MSVSVQRVQLSEDLCVRVGRLISSNYGIPQSGAEARLRALFNQPYQDGSVLLTASEAGDILGFQSYMRWPLTAPSGLEQALQSGNSIVSPAARGKGVFRSLLQYSDLDVDRHIRFGFPVQASYPAFISAGWTNPFDLVWWFKPLKPFTRNRHWPSIGEVVPDASIRGATPYGRISMAGDLSFDEWRLGLIRPSNLNRMDTLGGEISVEATFKKRQLRGPVEITEFLIGAIRGETADVGAVAAALREAVSRVSTLGLAHAVTVAVPELSRELMAATAEAGFRPLRRRIPFVVKGPWDSLGVPWSKWWVFRGDIDTW